MCCRPRASGRGRCGLSFKFSLRNAYDITYKTYNRSWITRKETGVSSSIMQSRVYLSLAPRKKKHRTRLLSQRSSFYNYFKSFNCFISQFENSNQVPCSPKTEHSLVSFLVSCTTIRVFKFHIGHSSFRMMTWHVAASL